MEDTNNVDVANAIRILEGTNRSEQARGWTFNTIESYTLNPDFFSKKIYWQDSFLYIVGLNQEKYIKKGEYLYDVDNQTFDFETSITVKCRLLVEFEDMPEALRSYITAKAARIFQTRYLGDQVLTEELARDEMEAWARLQEYELELNEFNIFDNLAVQETMGR